MDKEQVDFYENSEIYFNLLANADRIYFNDYILFVEYFLPKGKYILDAGCGTGQSSMLLKEKGYRVKGLDGAERFIKQAKKKFPDIDFIQNDLTNIEESDNTFDAVGTYNTLEHVNNLKKVLEEMLRVVKPGGLIIIHSPNLLSAKHLSDALFKRQGMTFEGKKNILQLITLLFRNIFWIISTKIRGASNIRYRSPNFNFTFPDNDASIFLNPLDIKLYFQGLGADIVSYQNFPHLTRQSFLKKVGSFLLPDHMSIIRIVVRKNI